MRQVDSALWLPCLSQPVNNTEFLVENLSSGSSYRFRMAAINRAGIGEPVELPQTVQLGERIFACLHEVVLLGVPLSPGLWHCSFLSVLILAPGTSAHQCTASIHLQHNARLWLLYCHLFTVGMVDVILILF